MNRQAVFNVVREMMAGHLKQSDVDRLDAAIDRMLAGDVVAPVNAFPLTNPPAFYAAVRKITGPLDTVQVQSIDAILKRMSGMPIQHIAYVLATAWHEARLKPQAEWGKGAGRPYAKPGKYGQPQYGRGLVQLTWDRNYEWADKRLSLNGALLKNFDLALQPAIAADILVFGMLEAAFASNGKPLSHYGPDAHGQFDFVRARQTVNILDKAEQIAALAMRFLACLKEGEA